MTTPATPRPCIFCGATEDLRPVAFRYGSTEPTMWACRDRRSCAPRCATCGKVAKPYDSHVTGPVAHDPGYHSFTVADGTKGMERGR